MASLPSWLEEQLQCPVTGVRLTRETVAGRQVYAARGEGMEPIYYEIDNGVPILLGS